MDLYAQRALVQALSVLTGERKPVFTIMLAKYLIVYNHRVFPPDPLNASIVDVSRQVREECLLVFFRGNKFKVDEPAQLLQLLTNISPEYLKLVPYISTNYRFFSPTSSLQHHSFVYYAHGRAPLVLETDFRGIATALKLLAECHNM